MTALLCYSSEIAVTPCSVFPKTTIRELDYERGDLATQFIFEGLALAAIDCISSTP